MTNINFLTGVNWQFAKSWIAKAGYRYLYQDYQHNGFVWDMTASGSISVSESDFTGRRPVLSLD